MNNFLLLQYSATGILFYTAYKNDEERFYISSLVGSPEVHITTKNSTYHSKWNLSHWIGNPERTIQDEQGTIVAVLIKKTEKEFLLRDAEGELTIVQEKDFFYGKSGSEEVFTANRIENLQEVRKCYNRQEYDLTYGYQVEFGKTVSEQRKLLICSFPMLRF